MQFSAILNMFIVKTYLNSILTNDFKRKENFSKNVQSYRVCSFNGYIGYAKYIAFIHVFLRKTVHLSDLYPELACSNTTNVTNNSLCRMGQKWSRVNFVTIFGDLYQSKFWGICNNLNQFTYLSSLSGPGNDVIKMAAIAQL